MTERERIELLRQGYARGMDEAGIAVSSAYKAERAAAAFPMPKVKRPRVVHLDLGAPYRVVDGEVQFRNVFRGGKWEASVSLRADIVRQLADLLDNPDEEVECE